MLRGSWLRQVWGKRHNEAGTGAGTVIGWVAAFCIGSWIFFGVVDWIIHTKHARNERRIERSIREGTPKPFSPQDGPGYRITY